MKAIPLKITTLAPFFYYSKLTNEGYITDPFIGDIALAYALNKVLSLENFYTEFREKPVYREIKKLPFVFSVAKPIKYNLTPVYRRNTLFSNDGGPFIKIIENSGRLLFKNYFMIQGIKPNSIFSCFILVKNNFNIKFPLTLRIGTGRECLIKLEIEKISQENVWLNFYSLKNIYNVENLISELDEYHVEFKLSNYIIFKNVPVQKFVKAFRGHFDE